MLEASLADINRRISLMPDSFFSRTSPFRYLAKGTSPGSCRKVGLLGEYSGILRSFLQCASIRLSSAVTTIVFPSLQSGKREQILARSFLTLRGVWGGCSPQRGRLVARMKSRSRQYRVKCLWQRSLVDSLLRLDHTAMSRSCRIVMKRWLSSSALPLRTLTERSLQESLYWMGMCCRLGFVGALGFLRQNRILLISIITKNFLPLDVITTIIITQPTNPLHPSLQIHIFLGCELFMDFQ